MYLHFLGIGGTFMGSLAQLAVEMGHQVTGSDRAVYSPMKEQLEAAGIRWHEGFDYDPASFKPDLVIVGNVMRRGFPCVEALLSSSLPYTSGPQWLNEFCLRPRDGQPGRWVLAVSGTHGKTTTSSLLAWILTQAGLAPGFLIGGVPSNFGVSARLGSTPFFVIEADEYDTAFFDKRSKFVHYAPRTLIINNLEFDHADIFPDLAAIQRQFHHLMRLLPAQGKVIYPAAVASIEAVLDQGCWSEQEAFRLLSDQQPGPDGWCAYDISADSRRFQVAYAGVPLGEVNWSLSGRHNVANALAALAAARHAGVRPQVLLDCLSGFQSVRRRMEVIGQVAEITIYDDFAHHPTAIASTLDGARPGCSGRLIAVIEPRSNTMRLGTLQADLAQSVSQADQVYWYQGETLEWSPQSLGVGQVFNDDERLIQHLVQEAQPGDQLVLMSNGHFAGLHQRLLTALKHKWEVGHG